MAIKKIDPESIGYPEFIIFIDRPNFFPSLRPEQNLVAYIASDDGQSHNIPLTVETLAEIHQLYDLPHMRISFKKAMISISKSLPQLVEDISDLLKK